MAVKGRVEFPEEPLLLSAAEGYGFFPGIPGVTLRGKYEIVRKLGWGQYSSTWLVHDLQAESPTLKYLAAKVLTVDASQRHKRGQLRELEFLQAVNNLLDVDHLPMLRDHFEHQGPHGDHICFVMNLLSTDLGSFRRSAPKKALPVYMVKLIIAEIVEALVELHRINIIHTDLKPDNILFSMNPNPKVIETDLDASGPTAILGQFGLHGQQYPIILSQPLSHTFKWNTTPFYTELMSIVLVDLGHAQWVNQTPTTNEISAYALRAPEVILGAAFDTKVDIWALGCMTFELLTGRWMFHPEGGESWRLEDDHLAKMMEHTGEVFGSKLLGRSSLRNEYFDEAGKFLRIDKLNPVTIEKAIENYQVLSGAEIPPAAAFIRACLRLDPEARASAVDLQASPWLKNAFACCTHSS